MPTNAYQWPAAKAEPIPEGVALSLEGLSVQIAMPTHRPLEPEVVVALLETQYALTCRGDPVSIVLETKGSVVHHVRSICVADFLESDHNRLFWIDSDISWRVEDFLRVLALSTVMPVVGGSYPFRSEPILFPLNFEPGHVKSNQFGCIPMESFGLGFTCITREVLECLAEKAPLVRFHHRPEPVPYVFRCDVHEGAARGEDVAFFADIREAGYVVHLDPAVRLGHIGTKTFEGDLMGHLRVMTAQFREAAE